MGSRVRKHFVGLYRCAKHGNMVTASDKKPKCSLCDELDYKADFYPIDEGGGSACGVISRTIPKEKRWSRVTDYLNIYSTNFLANCHDGNSLVMYGPQSRDFRAKHANLLNKSVNSSSILRSAILNASELEFFDKSSLDFFIITDVTLRTPRMPIRHFLIELMVEEKAFLLNLDMSKQEMIAYLGDEVICKLKGYTALLLHC